VTDNKNVSLLLIGSGRLARHLQHYFHLEGIAFSQWDRHQDPHLLRTRITAASHVLLAITDSALEGFYQKHLAGLDKKVVHFSGASNIENVPCAHPLMTFGADLYEHSFYQQISFILSGANNLTELLPGLKNSSFVLPEEKKSLYHAYCVLGGNLTFALHLKALEGLQKLGIPETAVAPYLQQSLKNALSGDWSNWSGPILRKDQQTIDKNIESLKSENMDHIYKAFVQTFNSEKIPQAKGLL